MKFKFLLVLMAGCCAMSAAKSDGAHDITAYASCATGGFLEGATLDSHGQMWAVDLFPQQILRISEGKCEVVAELPVPPNGAKFRFDGVMVLTTHKGLYTFDPATNEIALLHDTFEGKPLVSLNDLSFDAEGGLYFTAPNGSDLSNPVGRVYYMAAGSNELEVFAEGLAFPNGIAVHPNGRSVIVSEFAAKRLVSYPAKTVVGGVRISYVFAHTTGGVGADGMTFDADGKLYAAIIEAGKLSVFDPSGAWLEDIALPQGAGHLITNLAITKDALLVTEALKAEVWRIAR